MEGKEEGYLFELYTELEDDPLNSLQQLYQKIEKGLSVKYIEARQLGSQTVLSLTQEDLVARIEYDESEEGLPRIINDSIIYSCHLFHIYYQPFLVI